MLPITIHPAATYATKDNILFEGTADQVRAVEALAAQTINERLPSGTISGLKVKTA